MVLPAHPVRHGDGDEGGGGGGVDGGEVVGGGVLTSVSVWEGVLKYEVDNSQSEVTKTWEDPRPGIALTKYTGENSL